MLKKKKSYQSNQKSSSVQLNDNQLTIPELIVQRPWPQVLYLFCNFTVDEIGRMIYLTP